MPGYTSLERSFGGVTITPRRLALVLLCAGVIALLVIPGVAAQATTDYDRDDDGLIEVDRPERLHAIRWDMDGDGAADDPSASSDPDDPTVTTTQEQAYAAAFPNPATGMGCLFDDDDDPNTDKIVRCIGYELSANLNLGGSTWASGEGWQPIGDGSTTYVAIFEGNDRAISNLYISHTKDYLAAGLFGHVGADGEIRNVRLRNVDVRGVDEVGALVGANKGTVSHSSATGSVSGTGQAIGGLVGSNGGSVGPREASSAIISHSSAAVTVTTFGEAGVGGLAGDNRGTISHSSATGKVSADPDTRDQEISDTTTQLREIGGLVGWNVGTISDSHATGDVSGLLWVGGLVGLNEEDVPRSGPGEITSSYATGNVEAYSFIGGLVGWNRRGGTIRASHHTRGTVKGIYYVGGLVGDNSATIRASYASGNVERSSLPVQTTIGSGTICCFGVLVGQNQASIDVSYARGKVGDKFVLAAGGLVGLSNGGTIRASYARGDVAGVAPDYLAGGLIGRIVGDASTVIASYATGKVTGASFLGGLLGYDQGTSTIFTDSYWDTETSGKAVGVGNDDADNSGAIDGTETETPGATGQTTSELKTPTDYTDSGSNTEAIYANWNLDLDDDPNTDDDPWDFGTKSQYPVLRVDFNGDGSIDADDIDPQRASPKPPSPPPGPSPSDNGGSSSGGGSRAPSPPPVPTRSPIIGSTPAATAMELAGDLLVLQRHDQPGVEIEVGVGWISRDGQRIIVIGFVRDGDLGQTYAVVRREGDGQVVRRWIAPDSSLVYAVPWEIVNTQYTFPVGVILAIPLDDQYPWPNMLTRRFDGGDDRILAYDAGLGQWRHVPDPATFQARGYYWCNVTAADAGFFERITLGPPYPVSDVPERADYPVCQT